MKNLRRWLVVCLVLSTPILAVPAGAETGDPWVLAELEFDLGKDVAFDRYSIDITLRRDLAADAPLLIEPIVDLRIAGESLGAGVQIQTGGYRFTHQRNRQAVASAAFLRMAGPPDPPRARIDKDQGLYDWSKNEPKPYLGVAIPKTWTKGRYTLSIARESQRAIEGKTYTWLGAYVYSHLSGTEEFVGSFRFPGTTFSMGGTVGARIAIPNVGQDAPEIPRTALTLGEWRINEQSVVPWSAIVRYPTDAPRGAVCTRVGKDIVMQVGDSIRGDNKGLKAVDGAYQHTLISRTR